MQDKGKTKKKRDDTVITVKNLYKIYHIGDNKVRAAAVEQLVIWGERVGVPVIKQKMGADPVSSYLYGG